MRPPLFRVHTTDQFGAVLLCRPQAYPRREFFAWLSGGRMTALTVIAWIHFVVWLASGFVVYALYSRRGEFAYPAGGAEAV